MLMRAKSQDLYPIASNASIEQFIFFNLVLMDVGSSERIGDGLGFKLNQSLIQADIFFI